MPWKSGLIRWDGPKLIEGLRSGNKKTAHNHLGKPIGYYVSGTYALGDYYLFG